MPAQFGFGRGRTSTAASLTTSIRHVGVGIITGTGIPGGAAITGGGKSALESAALAAALFLLRAARFRSTPIDTIFNHGKY